VSEAERLKGLESENAKLKSKAGAFLDDLEDAIACCVADLVQSSRPKSTNLKPHRGGSAYMVLTMWRMMKPSPE
jgi:hypothetical protein